MEGHNNSKDKYKKENKENSLDFNYLKCMYCLKNTKIDSNLSKNKIFPIKEISCENCKEKTFSTLECFYCKKDIYLGNYTDEDFIVGNNIKCPYVDCEENYFYLMCPKCEKFFIVKGVYNEFTVYECPYKDLSCEESFISYKCLNPHCKKILFTSFDLFENGSKDQCPECQEKFLHFACDKCNKKNLVAYTIDNAKGKFEENGININIECDNVYCKERYKFINCPYCFRVKSINYKDFFYGKKFQCEEQSCLGIFSINKCPICNKHITKEGYYDEDYLKCPQANEESFNILDSECDNIYPYKFIDCNKCNIKQYFLINNQIFNIDNFEVKCFNEKCNEKIYFKEENASTIHLSSLKANILNEDFLLKGKLSKENYTDLSEFEVKLKSLEKKLRKIYLCPFSNEKEIEKNNKEIAEGLLCTICFEVNKNVIYAPCGHLTSCIVCYERLKKKECPNCQKNITSIIDIKKVKANYERE